MEQNNFSNILKAYRLASGYNKSEISAKLYISRSTYQKYETGCCNPPIDFVIRVSALYNLNPIDLMRTLIPKDVWDKNPNYSYYLSRGKYTLTSNELKLLSNYKGLCEEDQDFVLNFIKKFAAHSHQADLS